MMATEYSTASNLESSQLSQREYNEKTRQIPEDFVSPPSCWFENSVSGSNSPCIKNGFNPVSTGTGTGTGTGINVTSFTAESMAIPISKNTKLVEECESQQSEERSSEWRKQNLQQQHENMDQQPPQSEIMIPAITGLNCFSCHPISSHPPSSIDVVVGNTRPSPSWREISSQVLPAAARELLSSSIRRIYYTARLSYSRGRWHRKYSDMGHNSGGFSIPPSSNIELPKHLSDLPSFSSLPWIDRQLVQEWRTYLPETPKGVVENEDLDFERARTLIPNPMPRPTWSKADICSSCHKPFGPVRLRHHCRSCGHSFCQDHSMSIQPLPHLGYADDVPERVCDNCKQILENQNLAERVAWRLARCRDYKEGCLTPYFETGIDSVEEVALRVSKAAIAMAKSIPLGAQATVAVETVNVLRKYGLHGIYGIMLRQEFLAAADLLCQALGINKSSWPLSVHELSAAIFYALAQHRAMRGLYPEREHIIHSFRSDSTHDNDESSSLSLEHSKEPKMENLTSTNGADNHNCKCPDVSLMVDGYELSALDFHSSPVNDETHGYNPAISNCNNTSVGGELDNKPIYPNPRKPASAVLHEYKEQEEGDWEPKRKSIPTLNPVCEPIPDSVLASLVLYAPIALNFIYATKEVEMQLLAAQQGWRLLYASLNQYTNYYKHCDRPASAVFLHQKHKIVCLSIRGTASINDVITDIRQIPVPFPETELEPNENSDGDWTNVYHGQGLALCGMASAAANLFYEHIDSLLHFVKRGYRIRLVGHSLGGGVATMLGVLALRHFEQLGYSNELNDSVLTDAMLLKVYSYGAPSCFDTKLADSVNSFVTTVVLHDDVFPRLTPTSCRGLLKHLLHIKETWVEAHIGEDLRAVGERAKTVWAPRFRQNFALRSSTSSIKKYCKKKILKGKSKLLSVKSDTVRRFSEASDDDNSEIDSFTSDSTERSGKISASNTKLLIVDNYEETDEGINKVSMTNKHKETTESCDQSDDSHAQLLLEFLGGGDNETQGLIIDGEEFFEADESLVHSCDDDSELNCNELFSDPICEVLDEGSLQTNDSWSLDMHGSDSSLSKTKCNIDENGHAAVVLDESPLPNMFLPGRIIHIYSHRGVYRAAYVPRTFKELRRISLAGNMLSNHTTKSYFEGLLELQTVRAAEEAPPRWTAYDEDDTCCCCANRFTWASTSNSEAQEARDKHNCRSCGGLICDPCSKNRVPIPSIGLTVPVRVCDRCYNDIMGGVSAASSSMASSLLATEEDKQIFRRGKDEEKPERWRQKRSVVVDDLVSQMRLSSLT